MLRSSYPGFDTMLSASVEQMIPLLSLSIERFTWTPPSLPLIAQQAVAAKPIPVELAVYETGDSALSSQVQAEALLTLLRIVTKTIRYLDNALPR